MSDTQQWISLIENAQKGKAKKNGAADAIRSIWINIFYLRPNVHATIFWTYKI